jgi:hypothetical protein
MQSLSPFLLYEYIQATFHASLSCTACFDSGIMFGGAPATVIKPQNWATN